MDNPQAFPHGNPTDGGDIGMTLRDYFAGQALAGICGNGQLLKQMPATLAASKQFGPDLIEAAYCNMAYKFADAMLAGRSKP